MTTTLTAQDTMIAHLMITARQAADAGHATFTLHQETDTLYIISHVDNRHTLNLCAATRSHLLAAIEQWAEETMKWWERDFPSEHLDSSCAVADKRWEKVTFDEETADTVLRFARNISELPDDRFWATVARYLDVVRTTIDAPTVLNLTRAMFSDDQPAHPEHAFFPGSGGHEQLIDALCEAGWTFTYIDGGYHYIATAPNGSRLAYIEGDLELEPAETRTRTVTLHAGFDLWRMLDAYVANREALATADALEEDTESLSEATDDLANTIATTVLNATTDHR